MTAISLLSGGLDSAVVAGLLNRDGWQQWPLFVDYGQLNRDLELESCQRICRRLALPSAEILQIPDFGRCFPAGITNASMHILSEAFLPGRNLLFLLAASAYAWRMNCSTIAMGLLAERTAIFPDQTDRFIEMASATLSECVGRPLKIILPLRDFVKSDVVKLAQELGVSGYSCHLGGPEPCGRCISCREYQSMEA